MARPRFLLDENVDPVLGSALRQQEPTVDCVRVGDPGCPSLGTLDPDLLIAVEAMGRILVTNDRKTMGQHLADHFAAGRHTAGVVLMRRGFPLARYVQDLLLIWVATEDAEWVDRVDYIPY
jgi:hypothetical protein